MKVSSAKEGNKVVFYKNGPRVVVYTSSKKDFLWLNWFRTPLYACFRIVCVCDPLWLYAGFSFLVIATTNIPGHEFEPDDKNTTYTSTSTLDRRTPYQSTYLRKSALN